MPPPISSTSNSEAAAGAAVLGGLARTCMWFVACLLAFELLVWVALGNGPLAHTSLHRYFWYGASYESKLRELAATPNLPDDSILYAGWIDPTVLAQQPRDAEVTVYGTSFSKNLARAMAELRPGMTMRVGAGPGAPLNHIYGMYQADRPLHKSRVVVVGVASIAVKDTLLMNLGSLYGDSAYPYFFPRYRLEQGRVVLAAPSVINSPGELEAAFADRALWQKQLDLMSVHDDAYRRFLFAADPFDHSALGRLVRRGLSKHHMQAYKGRVFGPHGFDRDHEATRTFRGLLRQMVGELRAGNVEPIVVLFSTQEYGNHLYNLVSDILGEDNIPFVNSYDDCRSEERHNFIADGHFVHTCDLLIAKRTLDLVDATRK